MIALKLGHPEEIPGGHWCHLRGFSKGLQSSGEEHGDLCEKYLGIAYLGETRKCVLNSHKTSLLLNCVLIWNGFARRSRLWWKRPYSEYPVALL